MLKVGSTLVVRGPLLYKTSWRQLLFSALRLVDTMGPLIISFFGSVIILMLDSNAILAVSLEKDLCWDIKHAGGACLRWCKEVEAAGKLAELSVVKEGNCGYLLRKAEAAALGTAACNESACIYRLRRLRQNLFSGAGLRLDFRERGSYAHADFAKLGVLKDSSGRRTVFVSDCGAGPQCDPWEYESGAHAGASLVFPAAGFESNPLHEFVVVMIPNSDSKKPASTGETCFTFAGQRFCERRSGSDPRQSN
jgi:hypothetical protein